MLFPKASAVLLCVAALSEAISIPDVEYQVAASPHDLLKTSVREETSVVKEPTRRRETTRRIRTMEEVMLNR
jgi:hypothetical protein